jgi:ribosomal protein S18 acetylase RimI-like enzyme
MSEHLTDRGLHIRPFEARDQQAARQLILNGLGGHFGFIDETLNPDLNDILRTYVEPGEIFLVAEDEEGNIVGTGALVREAEDVGRIKRVSVESTQRRRGIGRAIAQRLLELARQRGYHRIVLETNLGWDDAIGLYRSLGFSEHEHEDGVDMELDLTKMNL